MAFEQEVWSMMAFLGWPEGDGPSIIERFGSVQPIFLQLNARK
jgi:hypothetical protein